MKSYADEYQNGTFEDMNRRVPSIDKICNITKWKPTKDLDVILKDAIRWLTQCIKAGNH
jgi:nucleoside-diphosphate-sugar epimerase